MVSQSDVIWSSDDHSWPNLTQTLLPEKQASCSTWQRWDGKKKKSTHLINLCINVKKPKLKVNKTITWLSIKCSVSLSHQVFIYNSITGCKECQNVRDKVFFICFQLVPVRKVLWQINLMKRKKKNIIVLQHLSFCKNRSSPVKWLRQNFGICFQIFTHREFKYLWL